MRGHIVRLYEIPALCVQHHNLCRTSTPSCPSGMTYHRPPDMRHGPLPFPVIGNGSALVTDKEARMPDWGNHLPVLDPDRQAGTLVRRDNPGQFFTGLFAGTSDSRFGESFGSHLLPVVSGFDMGVALGDLVPEGDVGLVARNMEGVDHTSGRPGWRGVSSTYDILRFSRSPWDKDGQFDPDPDGKHDPEAHLYWGQAGNRLHLRDARALSTQWTMFGGNYLLTRHGLTQIHDRME